MGNRRRGNKNATFEFVGAFICSLPPERSSSNVIFISVILMEGAIQTIGIVGGPLMPGNACKHVVSAIKIKKSQSISQVYVLRAVSCCQARPALGKSTIGANDQDASPRRECFRDCMVAWPVRRTFLLKNNMG